MDSAGQRIDLVLARLFPEFSRTRLQQWLNDGHILLDNVVVEAKHKVWGGEQITLIVPQSADTHLLPEAIPLNIVFEDDALLVIDKPAGLVVHPGNGHRSGTLANALLQHAAGLAAVPRAGIVHRLDKDTSGLLVVAKTLSTQLSLVRQLQARTVRREYLALVHGEVSTSGTVQAPIGRHPRRRIEMAVVATGKPAVTHYTIEKRYSGYTLLRCRLETGRTHQIRVHLAAIGHALVGDPVYGKKKATLRFMRQALHAERLGLIHPQHLRAIEWRSSLPADFSALLKSL